MSRSHGRSRAFAVAVIAATALAACSTGDAPAATIGGTEISNARLESDTQLYTFLTGLSGAPCGTPVGDESQDAACVRFTLANDIREEVVKEYAAGHDLSVSGDTVTSALDQVATGLGGDQALDQRLKEEGLVRADLVTLARRLLLFNEVERAIEAERVTDEDLQPLYEQQQQQYTTVEVSHILVDTEAEARAVADEVTPENFAEIAADRSIDTQSAQNGGSLGSFSEAQFLQTFDPTFAQAALALDVGQISAPVQTQFGWHVIELNRRDVAPFEDVRDQLAGQLGQQVFEDWMLERIAALGVEVNPRYGRFDADTGEVTPIRSTDPDAATGATRTPTGGTGVGAASGASGPSAAGATGATP